MTNKPRRPKDDDSTIHRGHRDIDTSPTLIDRLQNRDDMATDTFVKVYSKLVRFWCRLANKKRSEPLLRDERKDITSEVIAKAVRKLQDKNAKPIRSLRAWLRRITQNCINDCLRQRKKHGKLMSDTGYFDRQVANEPPLDLCDDQEERRIMQNEILKRIKRAVGDDHWEVLQLVVVEGNTSEEVGKMLNMTGANVRQIKRRVIQRIHQEYAHFGLEDDVPVGIAEK